MVIIIAIIVTITIVVIAIVITSIVISIDDIIPITIITWFVTTDTDTATTIACAALITFSSILPFKSPRRRSHPAVHSNCSCSRNFATCDNNFSPYLL
jgi:hypothetical protein